MEADSSRFGGQMVRQHLHHPGYTEDAAPEPKKGAKARVAPPGHVSPTGTSRSQGAYRIPSVPCLLKLWLTEQLGYAAIASPGP